MKLNLTFLLDVPELGKESNTQLNMDAGATVSELRLKLAAIFPSLVDWVEFLLVSVDGKLVEDDFKLSDGQTVLLLLPRSGG